VVAEAATDIIARERRRGTPEPWQQPAFIDKIVRLQRRRQRATAPVGNHPQFFDRSPLCTFALSRHLGYPPSTALLAELERIEREQVYQRQVFFIDHLGFLRPTAARRMSFEESLAFERLHVDAYAAFGNHCIHVPAGPLAERVTRITACCS
jgi:predicted ATPase